MNSVKTLTCPQCQQPFDLIEYPVSQSRPPNRRKYCSVKCKRKANQVPENAKSRRRYLNSPKGKATKQRKNQRFNRSDKGQARYQSHLKNKRLSTLITRKPCLVCLNPIPVGRHKFCSDDCQHFNSMLFNLPKNVLPKKCEECGNTALIVQRFCSKKCCIKAFRRTETYKENRRAHSRRRRARKKNARTETVYLEIIAKRDKYKCHICRKRVNMNLEVAQQHSATMDHLIPLSLGGDHSYANIRLAHRSCNSKKGNRAVNEQLLLFG